MGTLPASPGPIGMRQVINEFGDLTIGPFNLRQYIKGNGPSYQVQSDNYAGSGDVAPNVPTAPPIALSNFYGAHKRSPYAATLPSTVTTAYGANVVIAVTGEEECIIYVEEGSPASAPTTWSALTTKVMGSHTGSEPWPYIITTNITLTGVASGLHAYRVKLEYPNHAESAGDLVASNTCTVTKLVAAPTLDTVPGTITTRYPTFTGTSQPGASILIRANAVDMGTGTADGSGVWSVTCTTAFSHGTTYGVVARQTAGGVPSDFCASQSTYCDLTPAAPSLSVTNSGGTPISDGAYINYLPYFKGGAGAAQGGATVYIQHAYGGGAITSTTAASDGSYSVQMPAHVDGGYAVEAYQNNGYANSGTSSVITFNKDTVAPSAPTIDAPTGSYGTHYHVLINVSELGYVKLYYCNADGSGVGLQWESYPSKVAATPVSIGVDRSDPSDSYFFATVRDEAGNTSAESAVTGPFHVGATPLDAGTGSPTAISGYRVGTGTFYSDYCTASPTGGTPGYTYSWSKVSGSSYIAIDGAPRTASTCRAIVTGGPTGSVFTAVFRCTVTDAASATDYFDITVEMTRDA